MLKDLSSLIVECRHNFDKLASKGDILIDAELKETLLAALALIEPKSQWQIRDYSILVINENGLRAELPSSWLWYGLAFCDFSQSLEEYKNLIDLLRERAISENIKNKEIDDFLKLLPSKNYHEIVSPVANVLNSIIDEHYSQKDKEYLEKFFTDRTWWYSPLKPTKQISGKTLERGDAFKSALLLAAAVIVANADRLTAVIDAFVKSPKLKFLVGHRADNFSPSNNSNIIKKPNLKPGINKIYYGAPGTGKSYKVNKDIGNGDVIRTVFHPDTQYSDFVGSLKPKTNLDSNKNTRISYEFRAGPFTEAYIKSISDPTKSVYLVIEELNRAPAAAVFGELFQLLDRDADGSSTYKINISDPDMLEYINQRISSPVSDLKIPSNMSILATMNSSDQAVMPMDTAFKRRWSFEYVCIDYTHATNGSLPVAVSTSNGTDEMLVPWSVLSKIINQVLSRLQIPEDRFLGHRFLTESELLNADLAKQALSGKLFVYLWDDILRHGQREAIFNTEKYNTFGELSAGFMRGESIFSEEMEIKFREAIRIIPSNPENVYLIDGNE